MTDADVEKVARAIEAQLFRVQELGTGRGIVTPEDIARAALDASPVSRLRAEVEMLTKERDAALSAVNGEPVPELVENFYGYEGVRARVLIGAIDGLSEASLATRCNARASEIMQLVKRAEAAEAANARLVEALTTLVDNVEEAARDSFATSAETFEKDFEIEDADGYFAWKRAKDALSATPPAPAIAEAQRGWQPIETAPRDGTVIFVYRRMEPWDVIGTAQWIDVRGVSGWLARGVTEPPGALGLAAPELWMPLPVPSLDRLSSLTETGGPRDHTAACSFGLGGDCDCRVSGG